MNLRLELNAGGTNAACRPTFEAVFNFIAVVVPATARVRRSSKEGV